MFAMEYGYFTTILLKPLDMDQLTQQNLPFFYHQFNWEQAYRLFICILREKEGGFFFSADLLKYACRIETL